MAWINREEILAILLTVIYLRSSGFNITLSKQRYIQTLFVFAPGKRSYQSSCFKTCPLCSFIEDPDCTGRMRFYWFIPRAFANVKSTHITNLSVDIKRIGCGIFNSVFSKLMLHMARLNCSSNCDSLVNGMVFPFSLTGQQKSTLATLYLVCCFFIVVG
ncbi:hypothetical protein HHX48_01815 [Salinimonas sp. HHU 13199]|uniref:Uncharacterized protein n=1 Tax=Salinimonas profundi TaxID=2729140 RepID=A0ABR8LH98_9ALTE|nr:hypothetical protein [Salinimonas profundi]MBD3584466.1 hypothetical protein [Salinimonas profundi]